MSLFPLLSLGFPSLALIIGVGSKKWPRVIGDSHCSLRLVNTTRGDGERSALLTKNPWLQQQMNRPRSSRSKDATHKCASYVLTTTLMATLRRGKQSRSIMHVLTHKSGERVRSKNCKRGPNYPICFAARCRPITATTTTAPGTSGVEIQ